MSNERTRPDPTGPAPARPGDDPDQTLLDLIRDGDEQAYGVLLDRHLERIHALAQRMLGNAADAEEVAQDAFLRAWQQIPNWQPGTAKFSTWLHRVAMNLCHDALRRRRDSRPVEDIQPVSGEPGPEQLARRQDRSGRVQAALATLPERQREALVLSHYQELSQREAAAVLEISEEALESLLARGRRALRAALAEELEDLQGKGDGHRHGI
ncbi:RNA polymerase sigma factor [Alkalisalibacterium limincola]|uniref:RNA polymerase sigma factor n=1 Tax=Alkalisalibacterium limincola TaxID=2699169 RepID=A0A5C8KWZ7_9GAMM|nr:RNA polymerase sigma factor [Alkalisalibacterium limincola]TXK64898.1 RNA polymerase sigma factor [Alkalisalibacterium limincola]